MRRILVYDAKEMFIPVKSALQKMQQATFVVSKDTLNEHVLRKRDKAKDPNTNTLSISEQDSSEYDDELDLMLF